MVRKTEGLVLNVPHFFKNPQFVEWLNNDHPKMTWHKKGTMPTEWSDVVVLVDPSLNGEGSDSEMPQECWDEIIHACRCEFTVRRCPEHIMVRLTNLEG